ncbi:hypothetical protein TNCT_576821 [Trichonephila clavata]|uniref:Uncharacterized protein n=1 Tax=Trichonephila clavata TaxID=2740835 RepID=A0A8X6GXV4_TRICU|nr:hypothetical protein TNCT_576821 [Trichonephila clavata]
MPKHLTHSRSTSSSSSTFKTSPMDEVYSRSRVALLTYPVGKWERLTLARVGSWIVAYEPRIHLIFMALTIFPSLCPFYQDVVRHHKLHNPISITPTSALDQVGVN